MKRQCAASPPRLTPSNDRKRFAWPALASLLACACLVLGQAAALGATSVAITKTSNAPNPVPSGQTFKYDLNYTCSSTTGSAHDVVLTDTLPADIEFVSLTPTAHVASYTPPAVGSSGTITVNFVNPLPSGSAGTVSVFVRYKAGVTPNATVSLNTATVTGSDIAPASSSATTTSSAASTWAVSKTGATTATLGATGYGYTVSLCSSGTTVGQLDLQNAVMVDTLPVGVLPADVLNAAGATVSGTGAAGDPVKLTWNLGTLSSITGVACPASATKTVSIRYPATQFTDGQVVQNTATATGTPVGGSSTTLGPANVNTALSLPVVTRTLSKAASIAGPKIGQIFDWQLNPVSTAAVPLDSFTITDTLPGNFTLQSVFTGTGYTSQPSGNFVNLRYKTTANSSWTTWTGSPFAANTTQNVSALGLTDGVYVTDVEINYGTVPVGFAAPSAAASKPYLRGVITNPARDGSTVPAGTAGRTSVNNAALTANYNGLALASVPASASATIATPNPAMTLTKTTTAASPVAGQAYLGQVFSWRMVPANSGSAAVDNFTVTDNLPGNFTLQSVFTGTSYTGQPTGNFVNLRYKTTANSSWTTWTGSPFAANTTQNVSSLPLAAGEYVTDIEINYGTVPSLFAASGSAANQPRVTGFVNNPPPIGPTVVDGSTSVNNATLTSTYNGGAVAQKTAPSTVTIPSATKTATFTKAASNTGPLVGQSFGWQLNPVNTGTSPFDNFTVTDTLPGNFTLQSVFTGTGYASQPGGNFVSLRYKTTGNSSWTTWPLSPFAANTTQNVSALGLNAGVYVTDVEINYGTVPVGFAASATGANRPTLTGVVNNPARDGTTATGGTAIANNATLTASYGNTAITPVTGSATATIPASAGSMTLAKTASSATPPIGQAFSYYLRAVNTGNSVLDGVTMVDTLPSKFTLQSVYTGNNYVNPPSGNFITLRYKTTANSSFQTWGTFAVNTTQNVSTLGLVGGVYVTVVEMSFGTVPVGFAASATATEQPRFTGVVTIPARDGTTVNANDVISNPATLDASVNSTPLSQVNASVDVTMSTAGTSSLTKARSNATPAIGQVFDWQLSPANTGVVALNNFILTDTLPSQFELKSITTGTVYLNSPGGTFIAIRYKTTANSNFRTWNGSPFAASSTALLVTALPLGQGEYVTDVEMNFGTVPVGFATSGTAGNKPKLTGVVNNPARDASAVASGTAINNQNATLTADYLGSAITPATASASVSMILGTTLTKNSGINGSATSVTQFDFGQSFEWRLRPVNATGAGLTSFIVTDTLPG